MRYILEELLIIDRPAQFLADALANGVAPRPGFAAKSNRQGGRTSGEPALWGGIAPKSMVGRCSCFLPGIRAERCEVRIFFRWRHCRTQFKSWYSDREKTIMPIPSERAVMPIKTHSAVKLPTGK